MSLQDTLGWLLHPDAARRRHAIASLPPCAEADYALRSSLLLDRDATVRVAAAHALRHATIDASSWLLEATADAKPTVRQSAWETLAISKSGDVVAPALHAAQHDPAWRVRRAAAITWIASARELEPRAAASLLTDPFWRVRMPVIQALVRRPRTLSELEQRLNANETQRAALQYARKLLAGDAVPLVPRTPARDVPLDPDPAVATALLECGAELPDAQLVELLADSHRPLRQQALTRLRRAPHVWRVASRWLDDPRIPHAPRAVLSLLRAGGNDTRPVVESILRGSDYGPHALCFALDWAGQTRCMDLAEDVRRLRADDDANVRAHAVVATFQLEGDVDTLATHARDPDRAVRDAVVEVLAQVRAHEALAAIALDSVSVPVQRHLVRAACETNDQNRLLAVASTHADVWAASDALAHLHASHAAPEALVRRARTHEDPWMRAAVVDSRNAAHVLAEDPDPYVRRVAWEASYQTRADAACATDSSDVWLRTQGALKLRVQSDLPAILSLAHDREPMVRAAATEVLDASDDLVTELKRLDSRDARLWLFGLGEISALEEIELPRRSRVAPIEPQPIPAPRTLGGTDVTLPVITISGAFDLPHASYRAALERGARSFFWEPRYRALTRFLRRRNVSPHATVIAGTFHAGRKAITADVHTALRRLRRDALDVFLLFWVRSPARLDDDSYETLQLLQDAGKIRAFGFSTHDRTIAADALHERRWNAVMTRHNAAHTGAESSVFPAAVQTGAGAISFSALCYGRMIAGAGAPSAVDCYRYSAAQPGVSTVLTAPRRAGELEHNLTVLDAPPLTAEETKRLRAHGRTVYARNRDFNNLVRRVPETPWARTWDTEHTEDQRLGRAGE